MCVHVSNVHTSIRRVFLEVVDTDRDLCPRYQHLELVLVEEAEPVRWDDGPQAAPEGLELSTQLHVETVVGHQVDVLHTVGLGHRHFAPTSLQLKNLKHHHNINSLQWLHTQHK